VFKKLKTALKHCFRYFHIFENIILKFKNNYINLKLLNKINFYYNFYFFYGSYRNPTFRIFYSDCQAADSTMRAIEVVNDADTLSLTVGPCTSHQMTAFNSLRAHMTAVGHSAFVLSKREYRCGHCQKVRYVMNGQSDWRQVDRQTGFRSLAMRASCVDICAGTRRVRRAMMETRKF